LPESFAASASCEVLLSSRCIAANEAAELYCSSQLGCERICCQNLALLCLLHFAQRAAHVVYIQRRLDSAQQSDVYSLTCTCNSRRFSSAPDGSRTIRCARTSGRFVHMCRSRYGCTSRCKLRVVSRRIDGVAIFVKASRSCIRFGAARANSSRTFERARSGVARSAYRA